MFETQGGTRNRTRDLPKKGSAFILSSDHRTNNCGLRAAARLQHGVGEICFRSDLCKTLRVWRVQDNSLLFALRACMLRSHHIKAHTTADTMHKLAGFEVIHLILYILVRLHQGVPIEQTLQQGYGRCCRITGGDSQNPGGSTPVPDEVADSTGEAGQRGTRSQSRAVVYSRLRPLSIICLWRMRCHA